MPRWLLFLFFFTMALLLLGGVHYYFYRRLVVAPALPAPFSTVIGGGLLLAILSFPLSFLFIRVLDVGLAKYVVFPLYVWLGCMLMLFFLLLSIDLVQGVAWIGARLAGRPSLVVDPERRLLLSRIIAGASAGTVLVGTVYSLWHGLGTLIVKRVEVQLPKLPKRLDGFTIAQLSDIHLGAMRGGDWWQQVVQRTNALGADLIAITGDLADATPQQLVSELKVMRELKAPLGVFFVTGNHEYFGDLKAWLTALREMNIQVLHNQRHRVEKDGAAFDLLGIDDHEGSRFAPDQGADVAKAVAQRDPQLASVLLAHQPKAIDEAAQHKVGLVLAGHTHGGQIWPWKYLVYLQQPYVSGLHRHGETQIYINPGTGFWGPPMRLGSTAEITQVVLRSEKSEA